MCRYVALQEAAKQFPAVTVSSIVDLQAEVGPTFAGLRSFVRHADTACFAPARLYAHMLVRRIKVKKDTPWAQSRHFLNMRPLYFLRWMRTNPLKLCPDDGVAVADEDLVCVHGTAAAPSTTSTSQPPPPSSVVLFHAIILCSSSPVLPGMACPHAPCNVLLGSGSCAC